MARRAQTYDLASPTSDAPAARSQSMRDASAHLSAEPDPNDPPLPSYSALMASESAALSHSPQPFPLPAVPPGPRVPAHAHSRGPSLDAPYAPVDYGSYAPDPRRLSAGSVRVRPVSDPNDVDFANLRITAVNPVAGPGSAGPGIPHAAAAGAAPSPSPPNPVHRQHTAPGYGHQQYRPGPRQRSATGGYPDGEAAASVYSLDSGMGAYANNTYSSPPMVPPVPTATAGPAAVAAGPPSAWNAHAGYTPQADYSNPYYSAANDFLGLPPGAGQSYASGSSTLPTGPRRQASVSTLARTNTSASALSTTSSSSMARNATAATESVGASSTRRKAAAIDVTRPPYTKEFVDDYRNRMKHDPDPEAQFAFAKYLIEAAKKLGDEIGHTDARLGRRYRDALLAESLRNIKKLAEGKEPYADAQFFLANLYGTGQLGLAVDHEKAYYLYLMASKLNHAAATYRSAVCNELGAGTKKDAHRATLFYRKAAALGDTAAMYKLGMILLGGLLGQPRNPKEAIVWLRRAAAQADEDNPHALHELALLHERPTPAAAAVVAQDPNVARDYFTQAAQLGYAPAQFKLGSCHEFGTLGCVIDPRRSIAWYTRAAEKGDAEAELALSGWYLTGSEGVLKQSDTEAYLWGRKAANKGLAKAEYAVGYYTEIGIGVKQDMEAAKRWYMRAASQHNKRAMQRLAELNSNKNVRGKGARPTRKDAETECVVM
ncbi:hypothetical protein Q5752_004293 [Cryptotrichosporon argae]